MVTGIPIAVFPAAAGIMDTKVFQHVLLAGPIVKMVLLLLIVFSIISWAIIFLKFRLFKGIEKNLFAIVNLQNMFGRRDFSPEHVQSILVKLERFSHLFSW